jgi:hypothetical protein
MVESRWLRWIGPGVVALGAAGLIASTTVGAGPQATTTRPCIGPPADPIAETADAIPAIPADLAATPWFRLDPVAADDGSLRGGHLVLGRFGDPQTLALDLPAESFAAGPFGRTVLAGADDGSASRLEIIDVASGCSWLVAMDRDVIRRASIDPSGTVIYEMRVDRATRADLGVWRRRADGASPAEPILGPIAPDARFGRTFSTELTWDLAGERLAVQSCGEFACRTRLLDPRGGPAAMLDQPGLGPLVGVDGDRIVTYVDCHGLPCPIVSTDITTGERRIVADAAGAATLLRSDDGARLVHEIRTVTGTALVSIALDGRGSPSTVPVASDLRLTGTPLTGGSAARLPAGWVLLAPDGRFPIDPADHRPQLRRIQDGATVPLDEAVR